MSLEVRIEETKELLKTVRHAAMATVNPDGSPHNTPYFFMYNPEFTKLYWGSHHKSQHVENIELNGKVFVAVYDSFTQGKGGLYITAGNAQEIAEDQLEKALNIQNSFRIKFNKSPLPIDYYTSAEQRMYAADILKLEVYSVERNKQGLIVQEVRTPIKADELVQR